MELAKLLCIFVTAFVRIRAQPNIVLILADDLGKYLELMHFFTAYCSNIKDKMFQFVVCALFYLFFWLSVV